MRASREQMQESHERIVEQASALFRGRGVQATSVADVMQAAGLTHGGFYRHFDNKDALLAEAIDLAFAEFLELLEDRPGTAARDAVARYGECYLSAEHIAHPEAGCPIPTLAPDVLRASPEAQQALQAGIARVLERLAHGQEGTPTQRRKAAARQLAQWVGAVTLARAAGGELGAAIVEACR